MDVDKDATVVIRNDRQSVKTIVKTDDNGSYVIVANPKKHLTVHDKDGKLLFDGDIETSEQQTKVPKEIWKAVSPMLEQMGPLKPEQSEKEDSSGDDGARLELPPEKQSGPACS